MSQLLFARLKQAVTPWHERFEQSFPLMRWDVSSAEYVRIAARFFGFVAPLERLFTQLLVDEYEAFITPRAKTSLLVADLTALTGDAAYHLDLPICAALPGLRTRAQAFGSMYVMEGSTLGGRRLASHFAERFAMRERRGYAYFDAYGANTGSMWNAFRAMAGTAVRADEFDEAADAAADTFGCLSAWFAPIARRRDED